MAGGEIVPGVRVGNCFLGEQKSRILSLFPDSSEVWARGDGFCVYACENVKFWFDTDGALCQIGVTYGFTGKYKTIGIGSTITGRRDSKEKR